MEEKTKAKIGLLEERTEKAIEDVLKSLNYPIQIQDLFRLPKEEWEGLYPLEADKLKTHLKQNEKRTCSELGKETVLAWVIEDLTAKYAAMKGRRVERNGSDRNRLFTFHSSTEARADLLISCANGSSRFRKVEITASYTDFYQTRGFQSLRYNKFRNLVEERAVLISFDIWANRYFSEEAAMLNGEAGYYGRFGKPETRIYFERGLLMFDGIGADERPIDWKPIPKRFWRLL